MVLVALILAVQGTTQARVYGEVRDAETGQPLVNATVVLTNLNRSVLTGASGHYSLTDVPAGPQHLTFRLIGHAPRTLDALVPRSGSLEINVTLAPYPLQLPPIYVTTPVPDSLPREERLWSQVDRTTSLADVKTHPLLAEPDAFQLLAGGDIAMDPESPAGLHIRGGGSDQVSYLLDGIPVFSPYHVAGSFAAMNPDALDYLDVSVSSPAPDVPDALSGVIASHTRTPGDRHTLQGSFSTSQFRGTLDGPISGKLRYLVSGRSGFVPGFTSTGDASQVGAEAGDWLGKVEAPAFGGEAKLLAYFTGNEISADAAGGGLPVNPAIRRNDFGWRSVSIGGEFTRPVSSAVLRISGWSARADADARWNGATAILTLDAFRHDAGARLSVTLDQARSTTQLGLRFERSRTSYRVRSDSAGLVLPGVEALTPVFTLFGRHARRIGERFTSTVGLSLSRAGSGWYISPRTLLRYQPVRGFAVFGSVSRLHQFGQSLRNPESIVGLVFPAELYLGVDAPGVPVAHSDQATLGGELTPAAGLVLSLQVYARRLDGILLVAAGEPEPFATSRPPVGRGSSRGASFRISLATRRYTLIGNYGIQRTRLEQGGLSYTPSYAATHVFDGGIAVFPSATWSLRVGAAGAVGRRTTIPTGAFEWESCNLLDQGCEFGGSPHYGLDSLGGARLPAYFRLDASIRKHWHLHLGRRDVLLAIFGTATNVLARRNLLTYARSPVTGALTEIEMRPLSPLVVGIDWRY